MELRIGCNLVTLRPPLAVGPRGLRQAWERAAATGRRGPSHSRAGSPPLLPGLERDFQLAVAFLEAVVERVFLPPFLFGFTKPVTARVALLAFAFALHHLGVDGATEPSPQRRWMRPGLLGGPFGQNILGGEFLRSVFEDHLNEPPIPLELLDQRVVEDPVLGRIQIQLEQQLPRRFVETRIAHQPPAARQRVAGGPAHLDRDGDMAEQAAVAAGVLADRRVSLGRMVQDQDGQVRIGEPFQRLEHVEHIAGIALAAQQGSERIDRDQVEAARLVDGQDRLQERLPLGRARRPDERGRKETDVAAETVLVDAVGPERKRLLGDYGGLAGGHTQAGKVAAAGPASQEHRQERRFARFPLAGEQGDEPFCKESVPDPILSLSDFFRNLIVPNGLCRKCFGHSASPELRIFFAKRCGWVLQCKEIAM